MGASTVAAEAIFLTASHVEDDTEAFTISTTGTQIFGADADRLSWEIYNVGESRIFIGHFERVSTTVGRPLEPTTGFASSAVHEDGEECSLPLWGIALGADGSLFRSRRTAS